jgi:hypothetical protein
MALVNVLAVRLELVTAAFQAGIKQAQAGLDKLKGAFDRATGGLQKFLERNNTLGKALGNLKNAIAGVHPAAALGVAAVAGLALAMRNAIRESTALADELLKTAQRTGESVETLSELKFVAEQNNVSFGDFQIGLRNLQRVQVAAIKGSKDAARAFRDVGLSVDDIRGKKASELLEGIADGLAATADASARTSKSFELLGRSGPALVPLLGQGGEAIRKARQEAIAFGAQISTTFANQADEYGDNLAKLQTVQRAFGIQLTTAILPALNKLVTAIFPIAIELLPVFAKALEFVVFGLTKVALFIERGIVAFQQFRAVLKGNKEEAVALGQKFADIDAKLRESKADFDARTAAMMAAIPVTQQLADETEHLAAVVDDSLAAQRKALEQRQGLEGIPGGSPGLAFQRTDLLRAPPAGEALPGIALDFKTEFEKANESVLASWEQTFQSMTDIASEAFQGFATLADGFAEALTSGADLAKARFGDLFRDLLKSLAKAIIRALILRAIVGFFGGIGLGGVLKSVQGFLGAGLGDLLKGQGQEDPFEAGVLGETAIARRSFASAAAPEVGAGGSLFRPSIIVNEATPRTWVEITDRHVVPRLRTRLRTLGEPGFTQGS